ncbi:MAG: 2-oxo acid dehydrogenase subunit E2 [Magnetococcus sp. DMHC-1]
MTKTFNLPELGENIHGGDLVRVTVVVGDRVTPGHPLLEIETDKAVIEVPADLTGIVTEILVQPGTKVQVGQPVLSVEITESVVTSAPGTSPVPNTAPVANAVVAPAPVAVAAPAAASSPAPVANTVVSPAPMAVAVPAPALSPAPIATPSPGLISAPASTASPIPATLTMTVNSGPVPASPSVRREARELGVEIRKVTGTGPHGRITLQDVRNHVRHSLQHMRTPISSATPSLAQDPTFPRHGPLPDFSRWGAVTTEPMSSVRRTTAIHLAATWTTVPQVTGHERADITDLEVMRKQISSRLAKEGGPTLTLTAILVKVVATALHLFPKFNAAVDMTRQEVIYKKYIHVGIAVDTPHGLLVPVLRDANQKNLTRIATELADLSTRARTRKLKPDDMQGGCFTLSNLGALGGTGFNPIINYPEVAILGVAQGRLEPVYRDTELQPRLMLPLSLSYDHRLIDGADGTRFLRWIRDAIEQPLLMFVEG